MGIRSYYFKYDYSFFDDLVNIRPIVSVSIQENEEFKYLKMAVRAIFIT